jgi:hypothetical protein
MIIVLLTTGFPEDCSSRGQAFKQIVTKSQNAGAGRAGAAPQRSCGLAELKVFSRSPG